MARSYSLDLRKRVVEAIEAGLSTREAARRFSIGISTSGAWYWTWCSSGSLEPGRQGKPKISRSWTRTRRLFSPWWIPMIGTSRLLRSPSISQQSAGSKPD